MKSLSLPETNNNFSGNILVEECLIKKIVFKLTLLRVNVKLLGNLTLFDVNKLAENFFANLFTIIRNSKYENINLEKKNAKAIDIIDRMNKIVIQITSDNSSTKVKETIKKFKETKYSKENYELQILIISDNKNFRKNYGIKILFIENLINEIQKLKENSKIKAVCEFLDENINFQISPQIIDITDFNTPIRPKNIMRFYKTLGVDFTPEQHKKDMGLINKYIDRLCHVDCETRIIFGLMANLMYKFNNFKKIVTQINPISQKWLNINILQNSIPYWGKRGILRVLDDMDKLDLIIYDSMDVGDEASIAFVGCDYWNDLVYDLINFAKKNQINLKDIFEQLDFSSLEIL